MWRSRMGQPFPHHWRLLLRASHPPPLWRSANGPAIIPLLSVAPSGGRSTTHRLSTARRGSKVGPAPKRGLQICTHALATTLTCVPGAGAWPRHPTSPPPLCGALRGQPPAIPPPLWRSANGPAIITLLCGALQMGQPLSSSSLWRPPAGGRPRIGCQQRRRGSKVVADLHARP